MMSAACWRRPAPSLIALAALLVTGPLQAAGGQAGAHAAPASPAATAVAAPKPQHGGRAGSPSPAGHAATPAEAAAALPKAAVDPMEALRERLAQRLGATKSAEAGHSQVLRVVSKSNAGDGHGAAGGSAGDHKPAAKARGSTHTASVVAKLRAEKSGHGGGHSAHWAYGGPGGPAAWGSLKPEFAQCSSGNRQSPIDIRGSLRVDLEPIQFDYRAGGFAVIDNGHTVQVNLGPGNSIEVMGRRYELLQFHFHRPSEERIDGRQFDLSAHLVHRDPDGRLAVVAVLLDRGSAHPVVQTVWNNLPLEKGEELPAQVLLDPSHLLPQDRRYFTFMGSLTTPPCSEGVLWMVMQQAVPVSPEQVAVFSRLYPMNARPVQALAGRLIKGSN